MPNVALNLDYAKWITESYAFEKIIFDSAHSWIRECTRDSRNWRLSSIDLKIELEQMGLQIAVRVSRIERKRKRALAHIHNKRLRCGQSTLSTSGMPRISALKRRRLVSGNVRLAKSSSIASAFARELPSFSPFPCAIRAGISMDNKTPDIRYVFLFAMAAQH